MIASGAYNYTPSQFQRGQEQDYEQFKNTAQAPTPYQDTGFNFNAQDLQNQPGYQFQLGQGQAAIQGGAAAQGGLLSGATQKALAKYGQGLAGTEFGQEYARQRGAYEANRRFGMGQYQEELGRYQNERNFGANQFANNRAFARGQYAGNTEMDYNNWLNYNRSMQNEMGNRFTRQQDLSNVGVNAGTRLGQMSYGYGSDQANLALVRGNANAQGWRNMGNAFQQQGQNLSSMGGGSGMNTGVGQTGQNTGVQTTQFGNTGNTGDTGNTDYYNFGGQQGSFDFGCGSYG
jgi:hypothetical protein